MVNNIGFLRVLSIQTSPSPTDSSSPTVFLACSTVTGATVELVLGNCRAPLTGRPVKASHLTPAFLSVWKCQVRSCPRLASATSSRVHRRAAGAEAEHGAAVTSPRVRKASPDESHKVHAVFTLASVVVESSGSDCPAPPATTTLMVSVRLKCLWWLLGHKNPVREKAQFRKMVAEQGWNNTCWNAQSALKQGATCIQ